MPLREREHKVASVLKWHVLASPRAARRCCYTDARALSVSLNSHSPCFTPQTSLVACTSTYDRRHAHPHFHKGEREREREMRHDATRRDETSERASLRDFSPRGISNAFCYPRYSILIRHDGSLFISSFSSYIVYVDARRFLQCDLSITSFSCQLFNLKLSILLFPAVNCL